jgi:hypothetical protein
LRCCCRARKLQSTFERDDWDLDDVDSVRAFVT